MLHSEKTIDSLFIVLLLLISSLLSVMKLSSVYLLLSIALGPFYASCEFAHLELLNKNYIKAH